MNDETRKALELCIDVIERFSYRWTGAGTHPSEAVEAARTALAKQPNTVTVPCESLRARSG